MEKKILQGLKTKFASLGLSEDAFNGVASLGAKTITEESQIENFIANSEVMLKAFNSESDRRVSKFQTEKSELLTRIDELEKGAPNPTPPPVTPPDAGGNGLTAETIAQLVKQEVSKLVVPLQETVTGIQTAKTQEVIKQEALAKLQQNPLYNNSVNQVIMSNEFNRLTGDFESADAMIAKAQEAFEPMISQIGVNDIPVPPSGGTNVVSDDAKAYFKSKGVEIQ